MSENEERLIMRWLDEMEKRREAPKARFRHYMAKIGPKFHPESAHGSEFPWDGSEIPWDGSRETSHGCAGTPLRGVLATPKTRTATLSALTVCQIAHSASGEVAGACVALFFASVVAGGVFCALESPKVGCGSGKGGKTVFFLSSSLGLHYFGFAQG